MTTATRGAPAPSRKTVAYPFFSCSIDSEKLFCVNADVSAVDALEQASCFLAAARDIAYQTTEVADGNLSYAAGFLIEVANAIVNAAVISISNETHHE